MTDLTSAIPATQSSKLRMVVRSDEGSESPYESLSDTGRSLFNVLNLRYRWGRDQITEQNGPYIIGSLIMLLYVSIALH